MPEVSVLSLYRNSTLCSTIFVFAPIAWLAIAGANNAMLWGAMAARLPTLGGAGQRRLREAYSHGGEGR